MPHLLPYKSTYRDASHQRFRGFHESICTIVIAAGLSLYWDALRHSQVPRIGLQPKLSFYHSTSLTKPLGPTIGRYLPYGISVTIFVCKIILAHFSRRAIASRYFVRMYECALFDLFLLQVASLEPPIPEYTKISEVDTCQHQGS
ncbi:hypothetical protein F5B20DRAFT_167786 [Whalleya microplaca]|nr:hypothetical protein F5B20DRAFT_167786 [Whalleya microplaca]